MAKWRKGGPPSGAYFWAIQEMAREVPSGYDLIMYGDTGLEFEDFPAPPWPENSPARLGRLEDLSGVFLEDFARAFDLPEEGPGSSAAARCPPPTRCGLWCCGPAKGQTAAPSCWHLTPSYGLWESRAMGRQQERVYHVEPEEFPQDFPERLDRFRQAAGLSWRKMSRRLKVNARNVLRWRAGAKPGSGHLVNLFNLAGRVRLPHILLPWVGEPVAA